MEEQALVGQNAKLNAQVDLDILVNEKKAFRLFFFNLSRTVEFIPASCIKEWYTYNLIKYVH